MNRQAQAVIMLLFGGAVVRSVLTDQYLRYVKEGLGPFLLAAGVVLVAAAVMTLWYEMRGSTASDGHQHGSDDHLHHEPRVGWFLLLPVLGLLLVAPPALGSFAAGQSGSVLAARDSASDYPPLPAGDPVPLGLLDYASRAVFDDGKSLTGRNLRLTGFITPGPGGEPTLARIVLSCCAADGRPIKVGLTGGTPVTVPPDTWVQVTGTYTTRVTNDPVNKAKIPYLQVSAWEETEPPKQQYE